LGSSGLLLTHAAGSSAAAVAVPAGTPGQPRRACPGACLCAGKHVRLPAMGPRL